MNMEKCDICKKVIRGEHISLGYSGATSSYRHKDLCAKCGKSIFDFIKKRGWWKEIEKSEKMWASLEKLGSKKV